MRRPHLTRSSSLTSTEDDVKNSLDVLDQVLDQFDDNGSVIHKQPRPAHKLARKNSLNSQIDDIFSALTQEIKERHESQQQQLNNSRAKDSKPSGKKPSRPNGGHTNRQVGSSDKKSKRLGVKENEDTDSPGPRRPKKGIVTTAMVHSTPEKVTHFKSTERGRRESRQRYPPQSRRESRGTPDVLSGNRRSRSLGPLESENQNHLIHARRNRSPTRSPSRRPSRGHGSNLNLNTRAAASNGFSGRYLHDMKGGHKGAKNRSYNENHPRGTNPRPPSAAEAQATLEKMLPRYPPNRLLGAQGRQKSMIDLRQAQHLENYLSHQNPRIHAYNKQESRNRRSVAVDPFDEYPPQMRQRLMSSSSPLPYLGDQLVRSPPMPKRSSHLPRMPLEAQKDFLLKSGGFSTSHPFITGEVPIHPELQGRLPFNVPSRTIPLRPEDYDRFQPERWIPGGGHFNGDPELHRRRQLHRQNSQQQTTAGSHWFLRSKSNQGHPSGMTDSGIGLFRTADGSRSSFGMVLQDKFQKNPNMYFPEVLSNEKQSKQRGKRRPRRSYSSEDSSEDTLIHSEGSFEESSLSPHNSMEGSPRMKTKIQPKKTNSSSSCSSSKLTIRNYNPKGSSHMLKEFEDTRRKKTSVDVMIDDFHRNLDKNNNTNNHTSSLTSTTSRREEDEGEEPLSGVWSVASSSAASFDFIKNRDDTEFTSLKKLISQGRIVGLDTPPPAFSPPSPPGSGQSSTGSTGNLAGKSDHRSPSKSRSKDFASTEDLTERDQKNKEVKRSSSSSNQQQWARDFDPRKRGMGDIGTAQLIADSTEKKFNFNPFKGMWKKKHYSFDFQ